MIILIEIMEKYTSSDKEFGINLARGKNVYKKTFSYYKGIKRSQRVSQVGQWTGSKFF